MLSINVNAAEDMGTWVTKTPMPTGRFQFGISSVNGKIYVIGGTGGMNVEEYDPVIDKWTTKAKMPAERFCLGAISVNGKIYLIAGYGNSGILKTVEEYDLVTNKWTTKAPMPTARASLSAISVNGKVYAIGGYTNQTLNTVEEFTIGASTVATPTNLTATANTSTINLSWDAVTGATGYNVKRSTTAGGPYTTIATNVAGNTYIDKDVVADKTYYYVVSAITADGESVNSNEASATIKSVVTPPSQLTGNKAILEIKMNNNETKEYDMTAAEVQAFLDWYDAKSNGVAGTKSYFVINKNYNTKPFLVRKEYLPFNNIFSFEVKEYNEEIIPKE